MTVPLNTDIRNIITTNHRTSTVGSYVIDKNTSEVLGEYTTHTMLHAPYDYDPPSPYNSSPRRPFLDLISHHLSSKTQPLTDPESATGKRRGPKPKVTINPYAKHFKVAHTEYYSWLDDYVYGSCMTAGGVNNGTMSASPAHVLRACMLPELSTEAIKQSIYLEELKPMSDRQARRICQCARLAIGGMSMFLERNPSVREMLEFEVRFADSYPSLPQL